MAMDAPRHLWARPLLDGVKTLFRQHFAHQKSVFTPSSNGLAHKCLGDGRAETLVGEAIAGRREGAFPAARCAPEERLHAVQQWPRPQVSWRWTRRDTCGRGHCWTA